MMPRGRFITFEGGEGVGKSTLLAGLAERLSQCGMDVVRTREPGGSPRAEALRALVLHPAVGQWGPEAEVLMMFAGRRDHLEVTILPALARGAMVLCDRFTDSTRAYQAGGRPELAALIDSLDQALVGANGPDLTFVLDAGPEVTEARRRARGGPADAFEVRDARFHQGVRDAYAAILARFPQRCVGINAAQPPERVLQDAWSVLVRRFPDLEYQVQQ